MKISGKDYKLLVGLAEFHFKFAEYVRESDKELFFRAIDYAKTFAESGGISFDYWHEDNSKFLHELYSIFSKKTANFQRLVDKVGCEEEAKQIWIEKKQTSKEDVLGMKIYTDNFIRHARELDYDAFSTEDWKNFINICKYVKDDVKFISFAVAQLTRVLGADNIFSKELTDEG